MGPHRRSWTKFGCAARPDVFGVLGDPVAHCLSPAMQNAAFAAPGSTRVYVRFASPPQALAAARRRACAPPAWRGLNVTVPHKEAIARPRRRAAPRARACGAVNTVIRTRDAAGRRQHRRAGLPRRARRGAASGCAARSVLLIGAGGSARARRARARARAAARASSSPTGRRRAPTQLVATLRRPAAPTAADLRSCSRRPTRCSARLDLVVNCTPHGARRCARCRRCRSRRPAATCSAATWSTARAVAAFSRARRARGRRDDRRQPACCSTRARSRSRSGPAGPRRRPCGARSRAAPRRIPPATYALTRARAGSARSRTSPNCR